MDENDRLVFEINLSIPTCYYWNGNPLIDKIVIPLEGEKASFIKLVLQDVFVFIDLPVYGKIYWWAIKNIKIWNKGRVIHEVNDIKNPNVVYYSAI